MKPIQINIAESIIEPFWDPEISTLNQWKINRESAEKVSVDQTWCMISFKWTDSVIGESAFSLCRNYNDMSVGNADKLIISAALTKGIFLRVEVKHCEEILSQSFSCADDKKHEYQIDISSISNISEMKISIGSESGCSGIGWFNWIGLADSELLEQHLKPTNINTDIWDKHLKPVGYTPEFKPAYGILMNAEDIDSLREMTSEVSDGENPLNRIRDYKKLNMPELHIGEFVNFLQDTRYNRERDEGNFLLKKGESAAVAGIIQKDAVLLRLAARYALSIASCENWDDGFICDFPTSSFNHRCFVQSLCLFECSLILDLAGEFFTETGRDYVLRKMSEEGIGSINFNTWKYEYIFHCNQMAWFSPGRIYGYAVLMKHYPRIEPYMDLALNDVIENINNTIEADGGYLEGPGYFSCVGRDALLALYIYARVKNIGIEELIPPVMNKTVDFGEVMESTDKAMDFIQICDSSLRIKSAFINLYKVHLAFMAFFFPDSVWPEIFLKHIDNYGLGDNPISWLFYNKVHREERKDRRSFIRMNITGHAVSVREGKLGISKILVVGNKAGAGHTHMDKGSFVYEYGGETFLMDPGTCAYDNPISWDLKSPDRHNMLVPFDHENIAKPENPLMYDVIPDASGDDESFTAKLSLAEGWSKWYKVWNRTIFSPSPEEIIIKDSYELNNGQGVNMFLNTPLDIIDKNGELCIAGNSGKLRIHVPDGCEYKVEKLDHPLFQHNRIMISVGSTAGEIEVRLKMQT